MLTQPQICNVNPYAPNLQWLTLRYICPCPPAVPLSRTDWLIVVVAEAPTGRLLVVDPDPDVTLACQII